MTACVDWRHSFLDASPVHTSYTTTFTERCSYPLHRMTFMASDGNARLVRGQFAVRHLLRQFNTSSVRRTSYNGK
jgi:hypothetical protein